MLRLRPRPLRRRTASPRVPDEASLRHDVPRTWDELSDEACLGILLATRNEPVGPARRFHSTPRLAEAVQRDEVRMASSVRVARAPETTAGGWLVAQCLLLDPDVHPGPWDRARLEGRLVQLLREQHVEIAARAADALEQLGRFVADRSGASIHADDLRAWDGKAAFIGRTLESVEAVQVSYRDGKITEGERYHRTIDVWSDCAERVAFESRLVRGVGPVDWMIASRKRPLEDGALRSMTGRTAARSGEIREHPVIGTFAEGLTPHEHFMRGHDAHHRAARQLERDLVVTELLDDLGAVLGGVRIVTRDCGATQTVREVAHCDATDGVCALCFGLDPLDRTSMVVGDEVGARAAWSIASGARAFVHKYLSISSSGRRRDAIRTLGGGVVRIDVRWAPAPDLWYPAGECVESGTISVWRDGPETERFAVEPGDELLVADSAAVDPGASLVYKSVSTRPIRADLPEGVDARVEWDVQSASSRDEITKLVGRTLPQFGPDATVRLLAADGTLLQRTIVLAGSTIWAEHGATVRAYQLLARGPRPPIDAETYSVFGLRTFLDARLDDWAGRAIVSPFDGHVEAIEPRAVVLQAEDGRRARLLRRPRTHLLVAPGGRVTRGDHLTFGGETLQHHLRLHGEEWLRRNWMAAIEREQASRGIAIPRVYWALLLRSMLAWRRVLVPGDTGLRRHQVLSKARYEYTQRATIERGGRAATAVTELRGLGTIARRFIA